MFTNNIYLIYMNNPDLALNNLQWLICPNPPPPPKKNYKFNSWILFVNKDKGCRMKSWVNITNRPMKTKCKIFRSMHPSSGEVWFSLFNGISTPHGLYNTKNYLTCKCLMIIITTYTLYLYCFKYFLSNIICTVICTLIIFKQFYLTHR